jgi:hypothetical protein
MPEQLVSDADQLASSRLGMRFTDRGDGRAAGSTLLTGFIHDGAGRGPAIPSAVGEDTDELVRTDAGWQFVSRTFEVLFG